MQCCSVAVKNGTNDADRIGEHSKRKKMNSMKTQELMIYDWVQVPKTHPNVQLRGKVLQVIGVGLIVTVRHGDTKFELYANNLEPVPLTEEIMDRICSHVSTPEDRCSFYRMGKIFFVTVYKGDNNATVSMKGVHQMQHLLRIVGMDNEVNLMKIQAEIDEKEEEMRGEK